MLGHGKGGKQLGLGGGKRRKVIKSSSIQGITKAEIRRLARRGGVKRMSGLLYDETRVVLKEFLEGVIRDSVVYAEYAKRKTIVAMDIVHSLKRHGITFYGFDM